MQSHAVTKDLSPDPADPTARRNRRSSSVSPSLIPAALLLLVLLSGCGERGDTGIFASIEREEEIKKSNLPEAPTHAGSMVYDSDEEQYYVALGQLYSREVGSNDWDEVDHPSGYREGHTLDIVNVGGTIYAAFSDHDDADSELFEPDTSDDSWTKRWSPGKEISKLIGINTTADPPYEELFAVTVDSDKESYNLVYAPDGIGDLPGSEDEVLSDKTRIIDGTYDTDDGNYLFVASSVLWGGSDASNLSKLDAPSSSMSTFGGASYDGDNDRIYLSSPKGMLAYTDSFDPGGTSSWTVRSHDDDRRYMDPLYVHLPGFTGVVVGLDTQDESSGGYYEVDSSLGTSRPDGNNYSAAELSGSVVHSFFVDVDNDTLFALTNGHGLWSTDYDTAEPEWRWE